MSSAAEFRRRASFEARRYGGDAWIFVRELLQNSRDAGAARVDFEVERSGGVDRLVCRDDGCGMTFEHARKFLFTLYASSKRGETETAGRFGIGFWSVLRFNPDQVLIRSAPNNGDAWELRLSGDLEEIERGGSSVTQGTEIELVRPARDGDPAAAVWAAVRRDARHLRRRDPDDEILDVRVNGRRATEEIGLDAPSLGITRGALRGAVALADRPEVDLLAHGLRVRTTATLDELLTQPDGRRRRPPSPDQLVPRVILDSRRLQVLMARGDARTDRELRRLVDLGRRGVRRLVRGQLDREAGLGSVASAVMRVLELTSSRWLRWTGAGLTAAALAAAGTWWWSNARVLPSGATPIAAVVAADASIERPGAILDVQTSDGYRGPAVTPFGPQVSTLDLSYRPLGAEPMLVIFHVRDLDEDGRVDKRSGEGVLQPYPGKRCREQCLHFELELDGQSNRVRLPTPTGHLVDPTSLHVDGGAVTLMAGPDGLPVLELDGGGRRRVEYRTGPGVEERGESHGRWPALPEVVEDFAVRLGPLRPEEAARAATAWVEDRVAYDTSADTIERHREAARQKLGFVDRCLSVGAGDCDVQNALLASILHRAGVRVRMAVGFVGSGGRALPGLHAWVEYRGGDGAWRWVDASQNAPPRPATVTVPSSAPAAGREPADEVMDRPTPDGRSTSTPWFRLMMTGLILAASVVGMVMVWRSRSTIRDVSLTETPDVAGLLRGALARPESYREIPALFRRRVVPMLAGRPMSLDRARKLAGRGLLAVGTGASRLARRAVEQGQYVVDGSRTEGEVVATVLGAVDLDRWDRIMDQGEDHPVMQHLETEAMAIGMDWTLVLSSEAGDEIHILDGPLAGGGKECALVAVDPSGETWCSVVELGERSPMAAALFLADHVVECLPAVGDRARRLLALLASAALSEHAERIP